MRVLLVDDEPLAREHPHGLGVVNGPAPVNPGQDTAW